MRESVHFITDICNMEELFLIDNQMESRLVQQKSAEDQVTAETETPVMNEPTVIGSSTTAASRFFRIDSMRESVHFITDICNMEELFLIDNQMESRLVQQKSAEDQVTAETETPVMNEPTVIGSCKTKQVEQIGHKPDVMYDGNSIFSGTSELLHMSKTTENKRRGEGSEPNTPPRQLITNAGQQKPNLAADQSPSTMEPVNSKDAVACEKIEQMRVTCIQSNNGDWLNSTHASSVMNQQVEQTVSEATDSSSLNLLRGSLDDTHLIRCRRRLSLKDDEDQSSAVRDWLNLEMRQLSYESSRSGQTSIVELTGSDTEDANRQTECARRSSVCLISADYEEDEASFQARLNKGEFYFPTTKKRL
ncbi:hypothetical protein P879_02214 [Paragonimus westermani]|uniref:Diacylglycerol kinase iota-like domain-containing protein n=1 Tax=Paragonimus westermani TaxID=34504 RepID=A0A8T0DR18_9TREM|nr:hypothetical protein P879_02214 [Paragonimus westermani]